MPDTAALPPLDVLLARIARPGPDAGGGVAAAVTGALAAALLELVAGVAARHGAAGAAEPAPAAIAHAARELRVRLTEAVERDVAAYGAYLEARRLPEPARAAALRTALARAVEVPVAIAAAAGAVLENAEPLAGVARPSTLGDLGVAATLATAALESAALTARMNLAAAEDRDWARQVTADLDRRVGDATRRRRAVSDVITQRA